MKGLDQLFSKEKQLCTKIRYTLDGEIELNLIKIYNAYMFFYISWEMKHSIRIIHKKPYVISSSIQTESQGLL